jgi:hypothetical protein
MNAAHRIVARLPLTELWREDGFATSSCKRLLAEDDITALLRAGRVQFVIVNVGSKLSWIPSGECFDFWKHEVKPHLAEPGSSARLEDFPGDYCYFASEWGSDDTSLPIVVCTKEH